MTSQTEKTTVSDRSEPSLSTRWFYAFEDGWSSFNDKDDKNLEERWQSLNNDGTLAQIHREAEEEQKRKAEVQEKEDQAEAERDDAEKKAGIRVPPSGVDTIRSALFGVSKKTERTASETQTDSKTNEDGRLIKKKITTDDGKVIVTYHLDPDEHEKERKTNVEVMEDNLFDVDLATMELFPVFWKGVLLKVVRAHWFYLSNDGGFAPIPANEGLSEDLDEVYDDLKPWKETKENSSEDDNKDGLPLRSLPSMSNEGQIQFNPDGVSGRIFTQDISGRVLSVLGGSLVIRGWEETARRSQAIRKTSIFSTSRLPWAGGISANDSEREKDDSADDDVETSGSSRVRGREGAAKVPSDPKQNKDSSQAKGDAVKEENIGLFGRLWPSTDSLLNPRVKLLQALGWSKEDATEEGQRSARQKNTEEALKSEKGEGEGMESNEGGHEATEDGEHAADGVAGEDDMNDKEHADDPPELVLAIHGIGQKLTDDFDAIDFVYDIERLRNLSKKCADDPALKRIARGKRAQFLPICWRKELSFDDTEALEGNDNVYGLKDVSNDATIPMVRTVISKVILDVPYYLSRHKETMIKAVVQELNRVYRLFVRRNPDFEKKGGRVSLICHSLGSALAADILSDQPTFVHPLDQQTDEQLRSDKTLVFNVRNLFFVGSPNGFFFHLHGAQLIARRGTARTKDVEEDAARDVRGRYGCMAAEAVYNCYNATDPVAFQMSATVDREYAKMLRPISLPDAVPALLDALSAPRLSLSKYLEVVHPFTPAADQGASNGKDAGAALHPGAAVKQQGKRTSGTSSPVPADVRKPARNSSTDQIGRPVLLERGSRQKMQQVDSVSAGGKAKTTTSAFDYHRLKRAERRFRALNPHGCIDFIYSSGGIQYLDMLSAHVSYWTSKTFASFVLTQLFTDFTKEDEAPTIVPRLVEGTDEEGEGEDELDTMAEEPETIE